MSTTQGRMLLAVSPQTRARLEGILAGYDVIWTETFGEVRAVAARQHFDLVVVGSHFDESSSFDIVRYVLRQDPSARIACVRGLPFAARGRSTMSAFRAASEVLGAVIVVDLFDYPNDEAGNRAIGVLFAQQLSNAALPPAA